MNFFQKFRALPIVQELADRQNFEPAATVSDIDSKHYYAAKIYLHSGVLRGRWDAKKDRKAQTYDFMFEVADDAAFFRLRTP